MIDWLQDLRHLFNDDLDSPEEPVDVSAAADSGTAASTADTPAVSEITAAEGGSPGTATNDVTEQDAADEFILEPVGGESEQMNEASADD